MNYKIEKLDDYKMVYMRNVGEYGNSKNFQMMKDFKKWIAKNKLENIKDTRGIIGIAQDNPQTTPPEKCRYDLILFTDKDFSENLQINIGYFKGGKYAVFTITHTTEAVYSFWENLNTYILQNDLAVADQPVLERYKEEEGEDKVCEFLIPVE